MRRHATSFQQEGDADNPASSFLRLWREVEQNIPSCVGA